MNRELSLVLGLPKSRRTSFIIVDLVREFKTLRSSAAIAARSGVLAASPDEESSGVSRQRVIPRKTAKSAFETENIRQKDTPLQNQKKRKADLKSEKGQAFCP